MKGVFLLDNSVKDISSEKNRTGSKSCFDGSYTKNEYGVNTWRGCRMGY